MNKIITDALERGITYKEYRAMVDLLLAKNQTTGPNQSEEMLEYTRLNTSRMKRLDKTTEIQENIAGLIQSVKEKQTWLIITEAWCGDASQIVPVINKLAELNDKIEVKHVLRDENEDLMELFLTNGGKSIPIVVLIDSEKNKLIGYWGPRPKEMQEMVMMRKNDPNAIPYSEFAVQVQKWYNKEKTLSIQKEFTDHLLSAE